MSHSNLTELQEDILTRIISTSGSFKDFIDDISNVERNGLDSLSLEDTDGGNSQESISSFLHEYSEEALSSLSYLNIKNKRNDEDEVNPFNIYHITDVANEVIKDALYSLTLNTEPFDYNVDVMKFAKERHMNTSDVAPVVQKITSGLFVQYFDVVLDDYTHQRFIANVGSTYGCNNEDYDIKDYDIDLNEHLKFTMENDAESFNLDNTPRKISSGFVVQEIDLFTGKYLSQEATIGDETRYESKEGNRMNDPEIKSRMELAYMAYDMNNDIEEITVSLKHENDSDISL